MVEKTSIRYATTRNMEKIRRKRLLMSRNLRINIRKQRRENSHTICHYRNNKEQYKANDANCVPTNFLFLSFISHENETAGKIKNLSDYFSSF